MKYLVLLCDGMADYKIAELEDRTPMEAAKKTTMDMLASKSICGTVSNVPNGMVPESDTANLAVLSYNPEIYSKGRSPLEAVSMGLTMREDDTAYRCNLVTLSEEEDNYEERTILDHSADEITIDEASELVKALEEAFSTEDRHFFTGVSYRHCLIWNKAPAECEFMRPHDILGKKIGKYLPSGNLGAPFLMLMKKSYDILNNHPINMARRARGLKPANSMWLWSPGKKPALPNFYEKWGIRGAVISAVDLIKGIGLCAGMQSIEVEGATGNVHTNYQGKADAAIEAFENEKDLVYIHVEAPDECGHRAEIENKILSIEKIDELILKPVYEYLVSTDEDFKIMVLPDHPTPIALRTHSMDPVPFIIYSSKEDRDGVAVFSEENCANAGFYIERGEELFSHFIEK